MTHAPFFDQDSFRFRYDDGSESAASWIGVVNADVNLNTGQNYRVRFLIEETNGVGGDLIPQLQYQKNGTGGFVNVTGASSNIIASASAEFADDAVTTEQMAGAQTFVAGRMDENNGATSTIALDTQDTELEFCFQIVDGDVADGNTIELRLVGEDGAGVLFTSYTNIPIITVEKVPAVTALSDVNFADQNYYQPPFEIGSDKYGIFLSPDFRWIFAMKTTVASPTDGDWGDVGTAIFALGGSPIKSLWVVEDGSDLHVATQQENGRVAYHVCDPGTDAWTISDEKVAVVGDTDFDAVPAIPAVSLGLRSDGDVILVAAYDDVINDEALRVFTRESGFWTNRGHASISGQPAKGCCVVGPGTSDEIGWIFVRGTTTTVKGISSANSLTSNFGIDTSIDTAGLINGPGVNSGDDAYWPYIDASNNISVAIADLSSLNFRSFVADVSDAAVLGNDASAVPFVVACLALDGTDVHLLYADATSADLWHDDDASVSGGGTETEIENTVTANRVSVRKGTSDLLYFYDDAGVSTFGVVSLVPSGPIIVVPAPKAFSLTKFDPSIETGVNIPVPTPKAFSLTEIEPAVGVSALVTVPAPKAFSRTDFDPTIETGVTIIVPAPKAFTLADFLPEIASGVNIFAPTPKTYIRTGFEPAITTAQAVDIIVPAPKAYNLAGQLPTIETGVTIITPLGAFTFAKFDPTIETGVTITVPTPKTYSLSGFDPLIATGINISVPAPKGYSLAGFDLKIASGVNVFVPVPKAYLRTGFIPAISTIGAVEIIVPLGVFNLTKLTPSVGTGVIIVTPLGTFTLTKFDPLINTGVNIVVSLGGFTRTGFEPAIATGLNIQVPAPKTFTLNNFAPDVASGVGIVVPLKTFTRADFIPQIGTGVNIIIPSFGAFTITGFAPAVEKVIEVRVELKQFDFVGFLPIIHSNRPPLLAANILDLTPPFDDITQMRYLFRNFAVLRDLLASGVDGQFTTNDGKTVLVRGGIIVDLY